MCNALCASEAPVLEEQVNHTLARAVGRFTEYTFTALYWTAQRLLPTVQVGGLKLLDLRGVDANKEFELIDMLARAMTMIAEAKGGFGELVTGHLRLVVASSLSWDLASPMARAYITPFGRYSRQNAQYLACRLIWAATYIRLARDVDAASRVRNDLAIMDAALEAQVRFVNQFPDPEEWESYLRRSPRGFHRDTGA
jgi:hypothetical protein